MTPPLNHTELYSPPHPTSARPFCQHQAPASPGPCSIFYLQLVAIDNRVNANMKMSCFAIEIQLESALPQ